MSEQNDAVELVISARAADLGEGFEVRRALPSARHRMVGPFIFLDQMGPHTFAPGHGLDVRPHPHIGLATVTYLFEGELMHRDSLGTVQLIRPGEVNWMVAGRGIVHSERTPPAQRAAGGRLFGIQIWVALPTQHEEAEPTFAHYPAADLPVLEKEGAKVRLIAGSAFGMRSPVKTLSELVYAEAELEDGAQLVIRPAHPERAIYVAEGSMLLGGVTHHPGDLVVLRRGAEVVACAVTPVKLLLLGGDPVDGARHIDWNFVSSSTERLARARDDWAAQRFPPVPGETEFIPLPDPKHRVVRYP